MRSPPVPPALPSRRGRRRRAAAAAAAGMLLGWSALHLWADSPAMRDRIRARAEAALRTRVGPVTVGPARVDWLLRASFGPVVLPASRKDRPPVLRIERAIVRPRWTSLLAGRVEPGAVTLGGVRLAPGPDGQELRAFLARLRERQEAAAPRAAGAPEDASVGRLPSLRLRDVVIEVDRGAGRTVEVGPLAADLDVARTSPGAPATVRGRLHLPGGGRVEVELERWNGSTRLHADLRASLPADLPTAVARRLPVGVVSGRLEGSLEVRGGEDLSAGTGHLELAGFGVTLGGRRVGPEPLGPLEGGLEGDLRWDRSARTAAFQQGQAWLGPDRRVTARVSAALLAGAEPRVTIDAAADRIDWQHLLAALPASLHPPASAPLPSGPISAHLRAEGPPGRLEGWRVEGDLDLDELRRASRAGTRSWLLSPFRAPPLDRAPGDRPRDVEVGPENPLFVPLDEMPAWLPRAVTASEDAGFFAHRGFDVQEMAAALARGNGRLRGASTISQQLAKNLFLSPERTLSRKVREALTTVALESAVPKARLLEIYLNLVEWGPGVYGVGEAARFWLDKDARQVTPGEAAFLASVIPSPRRFHARALRGGVTGWWADRVADILSKMWIQGQLTDDQLFRALDEPLRLSPALAASTGAGSAPGDAPEADEGAQAVPDGPGEADGPDAEEPPGAARPSSHRGDP